MVKGGACLALGLKCVSLSVLKSKTIRRPYMLVTHLLNMF